MPILLALLIGLSLFLLLYIFGVIKLDKPQEKSNKSTGDIPHATQENHPNFYTTTPQNSSIVRPISKNEEKALRNCFPLGIYYLEKIDYRPQAILCRGKLRGFSEDAYKQIETNIKKVFDDRFLVLFQETFGGQPFFALVPNPFSKNPTTPEREKLNKPALAIGLTIITLFTTTVIGTYFSGINPQELMDNPILLTKGFPYSIGLMLIIGCHEFSHYLAARYYKIETTLPYFIPEPFIFLGTIGAFVQMRSPIPHRKALFDVALAGPIGGLIVTIPVLIWGLSLSEVVSIPENSNILDFESLDPTFSFLLAILSKLALGSQLETGMGIHLHPAAIAGYIGLIVTALNLMPIGQLDGGKIVHGMLGQTTAAMIGQVTKLLMLALAFTRTEFLIWAIILFFMPAFDQPALNDVTELDNQRDFVGVVSLFILVIILLPLPGTVAQWLSL